MNVLRRGLRAGLVTVLSLSAASCGAPTSPQEVFPPGTEQLIREEWALCQNILHCLGYDVERFIPEQFRWRAHPSTFNCGNQEANGCYTAGINLIEFNKEVYWVIRHECGHALMFELHKRPGWECFGHGWVDEDGEFHNTSSAPDWVCEQYFYEESLWPRFCPIQ